MLLTEAEAKAKIVQFARSIFERGLTSGASANMSVRIESGWVITPTNTCFGFLAENQLAVIDIQGNLKAGARPSKEFSLHRAMYEKRPKDTCIIHLHSTYATAWSCLINTDSVDCVPTYTPYLTMRLGQIASVPYFAPGAQGLVEAVSQVAANHGGIIMANHGPIVAAESVEDCVYAMEELEESCKLALLLKDHQPRKLTPEQINQLKQKNKV